MRLTSSSFKNDEWIPGKHAFAVPAASGHIALSSNINPQLEWSDVPEGTQSFVVICHDADVPTEGRDVNQEGREIPESLPRMDFFHWVLINIPANVKEVAEGSHSRGITPRGKLGPVIPGQGDMRHGLNDYTAWFAGDSEMVGEYYGYDGPCPPWNDSLVHHYVFTVYALDIPHLPLEGDFMGSGVRTAMEKHILAQSNLTGLYVLNPRLIPS